MVFWTADFLTRFLDSRSRLFRGSEPVRYYAQQMNVFGHSVCEDPINRNVISGPELPFVPGAADDQCHPNLVDVPMILCLSNLAANSGDGLHLLH